MIKDLIEVKQLPVIEEQLRSVSTVIDERVKNATSLVCTEESVKTIKEIRAELNKDYKELIGGIALMLIGTGVVIYGIKRNKKNK